MKGDLIMIRFLRRCCRKSWSVRCLQLVVTFCTVDVAREREARNGAFTLIVSFFLAFVLSLVFEVQAVQKNGWWGGEAGRMDICECSTLTWRCIQQA